MQNLTQVEGMSLEVLREGIRWDFESVPQYFDMLERRGAAINVAGFVGHSSLRTYVMGEDAPKRAATPERSRAHARARCWRACAPARSASPPAPRPRTTATAACRCPRGSPTRREMRALVGA